MKDGVLIFSLLAIMAMSAFAGPGKRGHLSPSLGDSPTWGNDVVISNSEPVGRPYAAARPNGMVYAAVPDTLGSGYAVKVYRSTNSGDTWSMVSSPITSVSPFEKVKVLRTAADSIYCLAQNGSSIYCWNVESPNPVLFSGEPVRDFDAVSSSQENELYIFTDILASNSVRRYSSVDGGVTWGGNALITSAGAHPRVYMSTGDTLTLNYYGPVLADTTTSVIRAARYRRTGPGTLATTGSFTNIVTETDHKDQFGSVIHGGVVWFFYTSGDSGAIDLKCRVSTDNGATFGTAFNVAGNPNVSEFWFDAKHWAAGVDLFYYAADTTASSPNATLAKDLMWTGASLGVPNTFDPPTGISNHPPVFSVLGYIPTVVEFHDALSDVGIIWVGTDMSSNGLSNRRLYWDRLTAEPTGVSLEDGGLPNAFSLDQNYPNPFNPSTTIRFALPEASSVNLKIFDVLGREVAQVVNGEYQGGTYTVDWSAANQSGRPLASGLYFYRLEATARNGNSSFVEVKKMMLLK